MRAGTVDFDGNQHRRNDLQWRGLRIGDRDSFDCSNPAKDLVGSHKVFYGAAAVQAQRDRELEGIERAEAVNCPMAFDQFSGLVVIVARQRNNSEDPARDVFQKAAPKTRRVAR